MLWDANMGNNNSWHAAYSSNMVFVDEHVKLMKTSPIHWSNGGKGIEF